MMTGILPISTITNCNKSMYYEYNLVVKRHSDCEKTSYSTSSALADG